MKIIYASVKIESQCTILKEALKLFGGIVYLQSVSLHASMLSMLRNASGTLSYSPLFIFIILESKMDGI